WREIAHDRTAIGNTLNDSFLLKLEQSQPNVAAMRVEAIAEILFDQAFARVTPAKYDILFQAGRDDVRHCLFAGVQIRRHSRSDARGAPTRCRPPDDHGEAWSP